MLIALINVITFDKAQNRDKTEYCKRERTYNYGMYDLSFGSVTYYPELPSGSCSYGSYNKNYDDAIGLSTLNHVRSMAGISAQVKVNSTWTDAEMACAVVNAKKGTISHDPKEGETCYSQKAYDGCRWSNLGASFNAPANSADSVLQYVDDASTASLGHRLWVLHPGMTQTAFGGVKYSQNYFYGLISINGTKYTYTGYPEIPFVAWPPPGPVHYELLYTYWSFQAQGLSSNAKVSVKVDGQTKSINQQYLGVYNQGFLPSIKFTVDSAANLKGKTIEVTVTDGSKEYQYTITSVDCGAYVKPDGKLRDGSSISDGGSNGGSSGGSSGLAGKIIPWIVLGIFIIVVIFIAVVLFKKAHCVIVASHVEERKESKMVIV